MTQELGRYCSYTPGRGETLHRVYEKMEKQWGNQLEGLPRADKLAALVVLSRALIGNIEESFKNYDILAAMRDCNLPVQQIETDFMALVAFLPADEWLNLCEALVNQLKYGRHKL